MRFARLALITVMLLVFVPSAFAYGVYGPSLSDPTTSSRGGFSGSGYGQYPTYQSYLVDKSSQDRSYNFDGASASTSSSFDDLFQNSLVNDFAFNERSSASENFGNLLSDGSLNLGDGYDLKVDKCGRKVTKGHISGEYFKIIEQVCSPVHGRLWKDNSISRNFNNEQRFDTVDNSASLNQNSVTSQFTNTQQRTADNSQTATQKFSDVQSTYGRGVVIILH